MRKCRSETTVTASPQRLVVGQRKKTMLPTIPELDQGLLQEGKDSWLRCRVREQSLDQLGLEVHLDVERGLHDRGAQLFSTQRSDFDARRFALEILPERTVHEGA